MDEIEHTLAELHLQIEDTLANADRLLADRTRERDAAVKERDELKRRNNDLAATVSEGSEGGLIPLFITACISFAMGAMLVYLSVR